MRVCCIHTVRRAVNGVGFGEWMAFQHEDTNVISYVRVNPRVFLAVLTWFGGWGLMQECWVVADGEPTWGGAGTQVRPRSGPERGTGHGSLT